VTDESTATVDGPKRGPSKGSEWSPARRAAAAGRRRGPVDGQRPDAELIAEEVIGEAVANMTTLAGFLTPIAPYTGITIAGVPGKNDENGNPTWIVKSRAEMAGSVLLEHAKRNRRVLAAVQRFNLMFKNVELLEVVGSVVASAAVDAKIVEPDASVKLPGGAEFPILYPAIGDTIEFIASQQEPGVVVGERVATGPRPGPEVAGPQAREPMAQEEGMPQTPEQAAAMRERLTKRNERISNGLEPTATRQGQTVVPGDVTKT
jgi:hypothetical protein